MTSIAPSLRGTAAACLALPLLAGATPPTDQIGTLSYVCAGAPSSEGIPVQNIELQVLFDPGNSTCRESFSGTLEKVTTKVNHSGAGSSSAMAQALPGGRLRVYTSNQTSSGGQAAGAIAGFTDTLLIDAPGLTGTTGWLRYRMKVKGTLQTHGTNGSTFLRILPLSPGKTANWVNWNAQTDWAFPDVVIAVDETVVVAILFAFGQPFDLTTVAWAVSSGGNTQGSVDFDAFTSLRLKGIDQVTTLAGVPVTQYTFSSQAGLPW